MGHSAMSIAMPGRRGKQPSRRLSPHRPGRTILSPVSTLPHHFAYTLLLAFSRYHFATMPEPVGSNDRPFALLRIAVGVLFLIFGQYKVFGTEFMGHGGFQFWIMKFLEQG